MKGKILIIDDNERWREVLADILSSENYEVLEAGEGEEGIKMAKENEINLILLDLRLPDIPENDEFKVLKEIVGIKPSLPIVMISEFGTIEKAVLATKLGAYDFIEKPPNREKILLTVRNALEKEKMEREITLLKEEVFKRYRMIGVSKEMMNIFTLIDEIAPKKVSVLITGESGVGKELVARAIHNRSERKDKPFVKINCAAIPEGLIESELFGYEKGAFTDAKMQKKGKLELADGGTLFLDEIGDMSLSTQAKLLRVLEEGEFERLGSIDTLKVDVRVIAATNKNLEKEMAGGKFREDLFYRLNVISIYIPPLRERKEDIPVLADYFLSVACEENGIPKKTLTSDAIEFLKSQTWKGNCRELKNLIERAAILIRTSEISFKDLIKVMETGYGPKASDVEKSLREARDEFERRYILELLSKYNGNLTKTAEVLKIHRAHLFRLMKRLGINHTSNQD
ncbi:MAG: sigma-54 dependent transcriptional regulator [candidate division WOR-3 bacterium]